MRHVVALALVAWWVEAVTALSVIGGVVLAVLFGATWIQMRALTKAQKRTDDRISDLERAIGVTSGGE